MTLSKLWLPLIVMTSLIGCVKADRERDMVTAGNYPANKSLIQFNNRALFESGQIVLEDIKFGLSDKNKQWKQVDEIQIYFQLCGMRDRATQGTIRNERFHIKSELGSQVQWKREGKKTLVSNPVIVNNGNCLRWSQYVPEFNFLAPSVNIALHIEIESLSGNLGKIVKRIGFNPWDMFRDTSKTAGFFDLTDFDRSDWQSGDWVTGQDNILAALRGELGTATGKKAELRFESLRIEPIETERKRVAQFNASLGLLEEKERERRRDIEDKLIAQKTGFQININLAGKPVVWTEDSTGNPYRIPLDTGRFRVFMTLMASGASNDTKMYPLGTSTTRATGRNASAFTWRMNADGQLQASVPVLLKHRLELGTVDLLVKIEPVGRGLNDVKPYTAVFRLGTYNNWVRGQTPAFQFDESYKPLDQVDYEKYVEGLTKICAEGLSAADKKVCEAISQGHGKPVLSTIREMDRFYFSPLKMRFIRIMPGETATDRTLQYSVYTCIEHGLFGTPVGRGLQFRITTWDNGTKSVMQRKTNEAGCLSWFGFLSHKYYRKEVLQKKIAKVEFVGAREDAPADYRSVINHFDKEYTYYLNPWDEKFTFGWDEPDMPENYAQDVSDQRARMPESKLFIPDFKYETMGFRYAIDKYLNLKVRKAVLLKAYPYVLKYNSIVRGRLGTEKLRDGIYLMKIALQKDYLDPAAKGVRIYDKNLVEPFEYANKEAEDKLTASKRRLLKKIEGELTEEDMKGLSNREIRQLVMRRLDAEWSRLERPGETAYEYYDKFYGDTTSQLNGVQPVDAQMTDENGKKITSAHEVFDRNSEEFSKKEFISVQTKLVRVLGGIIITPVEFEVDDLRLMRIRNQVFIQLETIDENKLRVATAIDKLFDNMFEEGIEGEGEAKRSEIQRRYNETFSQLEELENLEIKSAEIQERLKTYSDAMARAKAEQELVEAEGDIREARSKIYKSLGIEKFRHNPRLYRKYINQISSVIKRLNQYRSAWQGDDFDEIARNLKIFRNDKRQRINRVLETFERANKTLAEEAGNSDQLLVDDREDYRQAYRDDPFQQFLFVDVNQSAQATYEDLLAYANSRLGEAGYEVNADDFDLLKYSDFTEMPLTPSFDFNLLVNAGGHDPSKPDEGKSGLPSRTFVGPLTFVFNTNGSSLRPTDVLNETFCTTAFCESPQRLIDHGIPPTDVQQAAPVDPDTGAVGYDYEEIYDTGDSVNALYENNKYYGYIKEYADVSVDDLIKKKLEIDRNYRRQMEEASQIINFVKSMKVKYVLLNDRPESRLKSIDHSRCRQLNPDEGIEECLEDIVRGPDILRKQDFFRQLNHRDDVDNTRSNLLTMARVKNETYYNLVDDEPLEAKDLKQIITHGWKNNKVDHAVARKLQHRLCYVMSRHFFSEGYFQKPLTAGDRLNRALTLKGMNSLSVNSLENLCHRMVGRIYGYSADWKLGNQALVAKEQLMGKKSIAPQDVKFPPIILERKVRTYGTTGRYVYRGGKSLNINVSSGIDVSSSTGIKISTGSTFKLWDFLKDTTGDMIKSVPLLGPLATNVVGAFTLTRASSQDESRGRGERTSINAGTFLVAQMATIDIELDSFERCLVARLHPALIQEFVNMGNWTANHINLKSKFAPEEDIVSQGFLICTGEIEEKLPVREKYYYMTQHFTEGDMLDTADLHNHPWLLQLRGYRDFQVFAAMLGAREMDYSDNNNFLTQNFSQVASDAMSMKLNGSKVENAKPMLEVVSHDEYINWPLEELSRVYFETLPTFPGLYTFMDETGKTRAEWPYTAEDTPGRSFPNGDGNGE